MKTSIELIHKSLSMFYTRDQKINFLNDFQDTLVHPDMIEEVEKIKRMVEVQTFQDNDYDTKDLFV